MMPKKSSGTGFNIKDLVRPTKSAAEPGPMPGQNASRPRRPKNKATEASIEQPTSEDKLARMLPNAYTGGSGGY